MKFVLNKQTGIFVLREDLTSGIKAAARDLADLEGKKFKTIEDVTRAAEKEYNDAVKTKEQKKTEANEACALLQKYKDQLTTITRQDGSKISYQNYQQFATTAKFINNNTEQRPNQQQIDDYISEVGKNLDSHEQEIKNNFESIKKALNICANYKEEEEQISQQELDGAIDNVKILLAGGELLSLVSEQPEIAQVIMWLHKKLCVDYPEEYEDKIPVFGGTVDHAIGTLKFLFNKDTIKRLLINSVPVYGTFNMVKSCYIVIKYHNKIQNCKDQQQNNDSNQSADSDSSDNSDDTLEQTYYNFLDLYFTYNEYKTTLNKSNIDTYKQKNWQDYFEELDYNFQYFFKYLDSIKYNKIEDLGEKANKYIKDHMEEFEYHIRVIKKDFDKITRKISESKILKEYREEINNLLIPHMQKQLGFSNIPNINFIEDQENAKDIVGRTAYYDPNTTDITVYVTNRHPKDIMRSVAHEVIHHAQNERGEFDNLGDIGEGYFQTNPHLHKLEIEAYSSGNDLFRKWEENFKKQRNQNKMVNENSLRAKIRSMIVAEMKDKAEEVKEHDADCDCLKCKVKKHKKPNKQDLAESVDREVMPLREWRNMELNSLLLNRFGIVSPHVLGEKKEEGGEPKTAKQKELAAKTPPKDKITRGDVITAAKEKSKGKSPVKKGKIPPQFLKDKKEDESK